MWNILYLLMFGVFGVSGLLTTTSNNKLGENGTTFSPSPNSIPTYGSPTDASTTSSDTTSSSSSLPTTENVEQPPTPNCRNFSDCEIHNVTSRSVTVQWTCCPPENTSVIVTSVTCVSEELCKCKTALTLSTTGECLLNIAELCPNTEYNVTTDGNCNLSFKTESAAPSKVQNLTVVSLTSSSATLTWSEPEQPRGPLNGYEVSWTHPDQQLNTSTVQDLNITVDKLLPWTEYNFTIAAFNLDDAGQLLRGEGESVVGQTFPSVPSEPTNFTANALNSSAIKLSWDEPVDSQGPLDHYDIVCMNDFTNETAANKTVLRDSNTEIITGLEPWTNYTCYIWAVNLRPDDQSPIASESSQGNVRTWPAAPSKVQNLTLVSLTSSSATLTWSEPEQPRGPLNGYAVSWTHSDQQLNTSTVQDLNITVDKLLPWTEYNFTIAAFNLDDAGQLLRGEGESVVGQTFPSVPSEPTNFTANALNSSAIELSWDEPVFPQGPLDHYVIVCMNDFTNETVANKTVLRDSKKEIITGLEPWTNYTCYIWAVNLRPDDQSPIASESSQGNVRTWPAAPSKPMNLVAINVTRDSIALTWNLPERPRGPIDGYVVFWKTNQEQTTRNATVRNPGFIVDKLEPWTEYIVNVMAYNVHQDLRLDGEVADVIKRTRPSFPGGPPEKLSITDLTNHSLTITWNKPSITNGNIDGYLATITDGGNYTKNETIDGQKTQAFFDDLEPYEEYIVIVCSFNEDPEIGRLVGPCGNVENKTLIAAPSEPTCFVINDYGAKHVNLLWEKPLKFNGPLDGYLLQWGIVDVVTNSVFEWMNETINSTDDASNIEKRIEDLIPYTKYIFRVYAFNLDEQRINRLIGKYLEVIQLTKYAKPSPPLFLKQLAIGPDFVQIAWKPPEQLNGELDGYRLKITSCASETIRQEDVPDNPYTIKELSPWTCYIFGLMAFNGKASETDRLYSPPTEITNRTLAGIPDYPNNFTVLNAEDTWIEFVFPKNLFRDIRGPITDYSVIVVLTDPQNLTSNRHNGTDRELMDSWGIVKAIHFQTPYQASPKFWNPFSTDGNKNDPLSCTDHTYTDKNSRTDAKKCIIGAEDDCEKKADYCNGPLRSENNYNVKIRGFTDGGWSETFAVQVYVAPARPPSSNSIALGVSLTIVCLLIASLLTAYVIKRKGLWPQKKLSSPFVGKPDDVTTLTPIPPKSKSVRAAEFGDHVVVMMSDSALKFSEEFEELCAASPKHPSQVAEITPNKSKNRWANILPFDHSRVKLLPIQDVPETDYINASYIPGNMSRREYIATQGPLPTTKDDFWRMIWEQNVSMVVMLTLCTERGKAKCEQYWRDDWEPHYHCDSLKVVKISESVLSAYTIRIFDVQMGGQQRSVKHMHFTKWPDFGCPESPEVLINFVRAVRDHLPHSRQGPILVHCSAGVGRTGTFIAVDRLMQQVRDRNEHLDVYRMVTEMRDHRCSMVQTEDQYIYIHQCVREIIREENERTQTPIPEGFEIYSNLNFKETE